MTGGRRITRDPAGISTLVADESGSAGISTFFAVMTILGLLGLGLAGMRTIMGASDLQAASRSGARAASIEHDFTIAQAKAQQVVADELVEAGYACENLTVATSAGPGGFEPGGSVVVDLACTVSFRDLFTPWSSGDKALTASSIEPIDCLRGGGTAAIDDDCYLGG